MRPNNYQDMTTVNSSTTNGGPISTFQVLYISAQAVSTGTPTGTIKLQSSNDPVSTLAVDSNGKFIPINWNDIANTSTNITAAGSVTIPIQNICYPWVRPVFTSTGAGVQTIALVADVSGSLNNTYFLLQDEASVHKYYVWFNINSAGTDPAIAGRTGVQITGATNATASTLGTAVASAIAALNSTNSFTTSGTSTVTVTNKVAGPFVPMTDGLVPTGFTFTVTAGSGTTLVNIQTMGF